MDVNLPRDKDTGKTKGFGFLMYEDQRSTVLAVDNLNGAKILERTLRVDHVKNYKQPRIKNGEGEWEDREEQSLNAKPEMVIGKLSLFGVDPRLTQFCEDNAAGSESSEDEYADIDPDDPMRDYLIQQRKEEKARKKGKSKGKHKHKDETPEERKARKEQKKQKKSKSEGTKGVEDLLNQLEVMHRRGDGRPRSRSPPRHTASRERKHRRDDDDDRPPRRHSPADRERRRRSLARTPPRGARGNHRSRSRTPPVRGTREPVDDRARSSRDDDRTPPRTRR